MDVIGFGLDLIVRHSVGDVRHILIIQRDMGYRFEVDHIVRVLCTNLPLLDHKWSWHVLTIAHEQREPLFFN